MAESKIPVKAYTKSELADLYGISVTVLVKWITRLKDKEMTKRYLLHIKIFTPAQVKRIFNDETGLGLPDKE